MPPKKTTSKKTPSKKTPSKKKIFCGITRPIPKTHRLGSMKECLDLKQVRYYGLKKIDDKLAESVNVKKETKSELMIQIAGLRGKLSKIKRDIERSDNVTEKRKMFIEFEAIEKDVIFLYKKYQKL
jgi:hypothetical protein